MSPVQPDPLPEELVANLLQLATFMESLPDTYGRLCMRSYRMNERPVDHPFVNLDPTKIGCGPFKAGGHPDTWPEGVVACLVGHGPAAGIQALDNESWPAYVRRCFTGGSILICCRLFSSSIKGFTPSEHAQRIRDYIKERNG